MQRQFQAHVAFLGASLLLLIVVAVRLQLLVAGTGGALVYALDDAYIHLAMARNFAEHGTWGINPDGFANTTSSLLWTLLLSLGLRMGLGMYTPLVLGVLSGVALLFTADCALKEWGMTQRIRAAVLAGLVLLTPIPAMVISGMEHVLHAALTVAFLWVLPRQKGGGLCILAVLLPMVRVEGLFLVGLAAMWLGLRSWLSVCILFCAVLPVLLWGVLSLQLGWLALPNSILLKSALLGVEPSGWFSALWSRFLIDVQEAPSVVVLAVAVLWMGQGTRLKGTGMLFAAMAMTHLFLARVGWFYRYEAYLIATGWVVLCAVCHASWHTKRRWLVGAALLGSTVTMGQRALQVHEALPERVAVTWRHHMHLADFFTAHYGGQAVATSEAGAVAYTGCCHLVDLIGLGNMDVAQHRRQNAFTAAAADQILQDENVSVVALYRHYFQYTVDWQPTENWISVGHWREADMPALSELVFFARTAEDAARLQANLQDFEPQLAPPMALVLHNWEGLKLPPFTVLGGVVQQESDRLAFYSNGVVEMVMEQDGELHLEVSGSLAHGMGPRVEVYHEGFFLAEDVGEAPVMLRIPDVSAGDRVEVRYTNDVVGEDGADRNLYIWSAVLE